jgi:hypothetical protein
MHLTINTPAVQSNPAEALEKEKKISIHS